MRSDSWYGALLLLQPAAPLEPARHTPGSGRATLFDPEVGRPNPSELKAQKLARGVTRGLVDKDVKPNMEERRQINAILAHPPNRCLLKAQPPRRSYFHANLVEQSQESLKPLSFPSRAPWSQWTCGWVAFSRPGHT